MSYENEKYILQFFEGVHEKENRDELIEVYRKAAAFDLIDGYLTEAYNNYHDVEDEGLRSRLISGFISSKVTLLFQQMIEKYGDKEGNGENAKK